MPGLIHGRTIDELRQERKEMETKFPNMGQTQLRVYMVGKYGISHNKNHGLIPVDLSEVFQDDPEKEKSSA